MICQAYISISAVMIPKTRRIFDLVVLFCKGTSTSLIYKKDYQQTIKGGDVPRDEQLALTTVLTGVVPFTK
jgi:hypothetical protein